ncbi:MAG: hypothetical protein OXU23_04990, partial [Candidatus Poribacteria bacterium]|nr:hypothetical protein [Candidatus Poribacteria bacterium]
MSNIDESQVEVPLSKREYWSLISSIVVLGFGCVYMSLHYSNAAPFVLGIIAFIAAYGIRFWHQKRCRDYEDYLREQEDYLRRQLQKREDYLRKQARLYESIRRIVNTANQRIQKMRENLKAATKALNRAENHFNHTAYSPFWDEIEIAASELGRFSKNLAAQSSCLEDYLRMVPRYHGVAPNFPGTGQALPRLHKEGRSLANRMSSDLVYEAQRNFEFSNIYEHRKTRKTLIAGFKNLAGILRGVGNQISNHIEELNTTVEVY